ncbi:MAG: NAD(P)-binding domain-containing protein [Rhizobiaceae bacterium]|nr:NAD(P)-binding domain-containing protein [Rhizobiaceae bacterium]
MTTLGFIGTGTIAAAVVEGLASSGAGCDFVLSPRSANISRQLAARFDRVVRASCNEQVVATSDIVFLSTLPAQVESVVRDLRFRPGQLLCSLVAGLDIAELSRLADHSQVCRLVPLPQVSRRKGPILLYPDNPQLRDLLSGFEDIIRCQTERELSVLTAASSVMSTFFSLQASMVDGLIEQGAGEESADRYVRALFLELSETARASTKDLASLSERHETPGGLNFQTRSKLLSMGWFESLQTCVKSAIISRSSGV